MFLEEFKQYRERINQQLAASLPGYFLTYYEENTPRTQELTRFVVQGGKRIRPVMAMMYAKELGADIESYGNLFCALELFHDFLLVHDDIVDQDETRRGEQTVHIALQKTYPNLMIKDRVHFGQALATIGADVLHALAQQYILDTTLASERAVLLLATMNEAMLEVGHGWYKQFISDSMSTKEMTMEYILRHNIGQVTSSYTLLFPLKFATALVQGSKHVNPVLAQLCSCVGVLFQTGDDLLGIVGNPQQSGKSNVGDIIQGKKTLPVYFAYQQASDQEKSILDACIGKADLTEYEAIHVKEILQRHGVAATKTYMHEAANQAFELIDRLDHSDHYKSRWRGFVTYLLERDA